MPCFERRWQQFVFDIYRPFGGMGKNGALFLKKRQQQLFKAVTAAGAAVPLGAGRGPTPLSEKWRFV